MAEIGLDLSERVPKPIDPDDVREADVVVTMGCGDACPLYSGKLYMDWKIDDPSGKDLEEVRRIRDDIDWRVQGIADVLLAQAS